MPAKALAGRYADTYYAYSRPVATGPESEWTLRDREASLFNETLKDYLWGFQVRGASIPDGALTNKLESIHAEVRDIISSGVDPVRFDLSEVSRVFRCARITAINSGVDESTRRYLITGHLPMKALSVVEREFIASSLGGQVEVDLGIVSWRITELVVRNDVPETAVHGWMLREYLVWCWMRLAEVASTGNSSFHIPFHIRAQLWAYRVGLLRQPVWTLTEEFSR